MTDCDYSGCEISGDEDSGRGLLLHWSSKHDRSNNDCDTNGGAFEGYLSLKLGFSADFLS